MQSALRELQRWRLPLGLWAILSVLAGVAGPFGTLEALAPWPRLAYWTGVVGLSVGLATFVTRLASGQPRLAGLATRVALAVVLALAIHGVNAAVFAGWGGWHDLAYLLGIVVLVTLMVEAAARLLLAPRAPPGEGDTPAAPSPADGFLQRLPLDKRGALIRIEGQDHYLLVVTSAGQGLVLMRLADAAAELAGTGGVRVHRSHWIMPGQARAHRRRGGRDLIEMSDGAEVPVSRSCKPAARSAGLL